MGTDSHVSDETTRIRVETLLAIDNLNRLGAWRPGVYRIGWDRMDKERTG